MDSMRILLFIAATLANYQGATLAYAQEAADTETEETLSQGETFPVAFNGFVVAVIRDSRVRGHIEVAFEVAVTENAEFHRLEAMRPKIRDAYLRALNHYARNHFRVGRPADLNLISRYLQVTTNRVAGADVGKVYLKSAVLRR